MKVLACYNIKGGVGKTAAAVNLAYESTFSSAQTLIWDLDPQGAASFYFRIKPSIKGGGRKLISGQTPLLDRIKATDYRGLDLLPADHSLRNLDLILDDQHKSVKRLNQLLSSIENDYEYVLLDCAPTMSLVTEAVFRAADALVIPLVPTTLSLRGLSQILAFRKNKGFKHLALVPFFSMVDRRKKLHRHIVETLPKQFPAISPVEIPYCTEVERMGDVRAPVGVFAR